LFSVGAFLCDPEHTIVETIRFQAQIIVFTTRFPIIKGHSVVLHTQSLNEPGHISKLISILDKAGTATSKKAPRCLPEKCTAMVEITLGRAVCLELFSECKQLGRFTLRSENRTIAAGIVTRKFKGLRKATTTSSAK
jgi:elongation factor 1 alpha-like protein